jgi:predicted nucleic acid-binding protein
MLLALFPSTIAPKFKGVYSFFERIETGRLAVFLPELVLFQCYFVLTSFYDVPRPEAAEKLARLLQFRGIKMREKEVVGACLDKLQEKSLDSGGRISSRLGGKQRGTRHLFVRWRSGNRRH